MVPRVSFIGGFFGLLLTASLIAAAAGLFRSSEAQAPDMEDATWLAFEQHTDGTLQVSEANSGAELDRFVAGEDAFARGVYKSVLLERRKHGIDPQEPVQLGRTADGQLFLFDPLTSTRIALRAFGETNAAVFESLLERVPST